MIDAEGGDRFFDHAYAISTTEETLDHYARFAEVYDVEVTEQGYAQPRRTVEMLARYDVQAHAKVLDVGCGTGLSGIALGEAGFTDIDGCDYSSEMLELARPLNIYGRLFWADLNQPPIDVPDAAYDVATAVGIFAGGHLVVDAMDEILRCVSPGGVYVAAMNEMFYEDAGVAAKLDSLQHAGTVTDVIAEHGEHMPGLGISGWVIAMKKVR
ncbi:MAG: methyltransferase domain-containing protein [Actinomycetota bacterium]|nr:methyltransferase domain-containing protein [Actinomycetota bacterium]